MSLNAFTHNSLAVWSCLSALLLTVLSVALTFFPRLLLFLSDPNNAHRNALTPLEAFLALHFGIFLAALAVTLLLNAPSPNAPIPSAGEREANTHPLLVPLTMAANLSAFLAWNTRDVGALASIVFAVSLTVGLWGLWTIMFANSSAVSKTTGADKHTSAFIFGNKSAASSQKKSWRKGE